MAAVRLRANARKKTGDDEMATALDLFGNASMESLPQTRDELISRAKPDGEYIIAVAVCEDPSSVEFIWSVDKITPLTGKPYRRLSCWQIINPNPKCWMAAWRGCEGTRGVRPLPLSCPPELLDLVPVKDAVWRDAVRFFQVENPPSIRKLSR